MPNRILHESIKYCPKMEQLNWFEEVVYHRLTVTVDDYGCLDGRIVLLKNTLFPTREDISLSRQPLQIGVYPFSPPGRTSPRTTSRAPSSTWWRWACCAPMRRAACPICVSPPGRKNSACATSGASFPLRRTKKSRPRRKIPCPRRTAALFLRGKNT